MGSPESFSDPSSFTPEPPSLSLVSSQRNLTSLSSILELGAKAIVVNFPACVHTYVPLWPGRRLRKALELAKVPTKPLSLESIRLYRSHLSQQLAQDTSQVHRHRLVALQRSNIPIPYDRALSSPPLVQTDHVSLDLSWADALSSLATAQSLSLPKLIRFCRGETPHDPRPSKAMCSQRPRLLFSGYPFTDLICHVLFHQSTSPLTSNRLHRRITSLPWTTL